MIATAADIERNDDRDAAQRHRERMAEKSRKQYAAVSDIGDIPPVKNPERRARGEHDLHYFMTTYFPHSTGLKPFGKAQINAIKRFESAVLDGGRYLDLEPRGYVKSTRSENGTLWIQLYRHLSFTLFIGANDTQASIGLESIKQELTENELLIEDFPETCYPLVKLENKPQRCASQTYQGDLTHTRWQTDRIVLPTIDGKGGGIIVAAGMMAATRGMRHKRPDGRQARPDFVVIDDPQTDESAHSPVQIAKRMRVLQNSIMRLGGHGHQISAVINATVIAPDDMVDQLADHRKHPEWPAVRASALSKLPSDRAINEHWLGEYKRIRGIYNADDPKGLQKAKMRSTAYYKKHQAVMDEGAVAEWPDIPLELDEISPIQHAMNVWVDDGEDVFWAEIQNKPRRTAVASPLDLNRDELLERKSGYDRGVVPDDRSYVVFHVDVHDELLYWTVAAVGLGFTGEVIGYGTWPEQPSQWFSMRNCKVKLSSVYNAATSEEAIEQGLTDLLSRLMATQWRFADGTTAAISCGLVDAGYKPQEVANAIRTIGSDRILSSRGIGIGPVEKPMEEYDMSPKRVLRCGPDPTKPRWYYPRENVDGGVIRVHFDANFWKDTIAARLTQESADGKWRLFGKSATDHGPYVEHLIAERPEQVTAKGRTVNVWKVQGSADNHWFDTLVGCGVAASIAGAQLPTTRIITQVEPPKPKINPNSSSGNFTPNGMPFFIGARK